MDTRMERMNQIVAECQKLQLEHERLKRRSDAIVARLGVLSSEAKAVAASLTDQLADPALRAMVERGGE